MPKVEKEPVERSSPVKGRRVVKVEYESDEEVLPVIPLSVKGTEKPRVSRSSATTLVIQKVKEEEQEIQDTRVKGKKERTVKEESDSEAEELPKGLRGFRSMSMRPKGNVRIKGEMQNSRNGSETEDEEEYPHNLKESLEAVDDSADMTVLINEGVQTPFYFDNYGPPIRQGWTLHFEVERWSRWCRHAFATDHPSVYHLVKYWGDDDGRPYHYRSTLGNIYFRNPDKSSYYYNKEKGYSRYTTPEGKAYVTRNPDVEAERERYCFPCHILDGDRWNYNISV
ncbi:hypothetical protein BDN70DRAFT_887362 [Pholiota conissans]|uniref:Uncharacterized protein n=1 Tax=Pholiota conissans TaxID=109636 RepID=A0A9P5YR21_9AGAR|nr:hypothetical protein BDN70DRAFT_887362 [Pholiota conissans]